MNKMKINSQQRKLEKNTINKPKESRKTKITADINEVQKRR